MAAILFLSAFLAPILFKFLPFKFERIFNRLVMIFSLAAVVFFVRIRKETIEKYGLFWRPESGRHLALGFAAGLLTLLGVIAIKFAAGLAIWQPQNYSWLQWLATFAKITAAAFLIALIEEFFFRGFIFSALKNSRGLNPAVSMVLTSVFYSSLHFVSAKKPFIGPDPGFVDSLRLMSAPFASLADFGAIWPAALGLFLFGLVLNSVSMRTRSLYPAIGLHAGAIFFVKLDGLFVDFLERHSLLLGTSKAYDGLLGWLFLLILGGVLAIIFPKVERS